MLQKEGDEPSAQDGDCEEEYEDEKSYEKFLKSLDPGEFKDQDHYRVLQLAKLRYRATEEQIRLSCELRF